MSSLAVSVRPASNTIARADRGAGALLRRNAAVRRMLLAALVSTCGDRLHQVGLAALILGMTDSMVAAGFVFVMSALPYALFGLPVGALVDRWDRRTAMIGADLVRGVLVLGIPVAAIFNLPIVYGLLFCLTCATMIFTPARQSACRTWSPRMSSPQPMFVPGGELSGRRGRFPLAGVLVAVFITTLGMQSGGFVIFGVDGVSYFLSAALLVGLPMCRAHAARGGAAPTFGAQVAKGYVSWRTTRSCGPTRCC